MIPWFQYTTIYLWIIPIRIWGLFVALGMIISFFLVWQQSKKNNFDAEKMLDLTLSVIIGGLIFGRLFEVFFYEPALYFSHPVEIFKVWQGGMSSFGGLFGAVLAFFIKERKTIGTDLLKKADILAYSSLFAWMVGRIGCFMIHDHLGRLSNFFLAINTPFGGSRLEMALLEILLLVPLAIVFYLRKNVRAGWYVATVFIYYGILRFILDFFRATDLQGSDVRYFGLTPAQYFGILLVAGGIYLVTKRAKLQSVLLPKI